VGVVRPEPDAVALGAAMEAVHAVVLSNGIDGNGRLIAYALVRERTWARQVIAGRRAGTDRGLPARRTSSRSDPAQCFPARFVAKAGAVRGLPDGAPP
ncbi:hypothetical protein AB0K48_56650, partial [Nonomuraea sp. NPDC055795]